MTRLGQLGLDLAIVGVAIGPVVYAREGRAGTAAALAWGLSTALAWSLWQPRDDGVVPGIVRRAALALVAAAVGTWVADWTAIRSPGAALVRAVFPHIYAGVDRVIAGGAISALAAGLAAIVVGGLWRAGTAPVIGGVSAGLAAGVAAPAVMALTAGTGLHFDTEASVPLAAGGPAALMAGLAAGLSPVCAAGLTRGLRLAVASAFGGAALAQFVPGVLAGAVTHGPAGAILSAVFLLAGLLGLGGAALGGPVGLAIGYAMRSGMARRRPPPGTAIAAQTSRGSMRRGLVAAAVLVALSAHGVWQYLAHRPRATLGLSGPVGAVGFALEGHRLTVLARDGRLVRWDPTSGHTAPVGRIPWGIGFTHAAGLSPFHGSVATGESEWRVRVWDVRTGQIWREVHQHARDVTGVAFSPDGQLLASASLDGTVFWQDVRTWRRWGTIYLATPPHAVTFGPDSRMLAIGLDGGLVVWDTGAQRPHAALGGLPGQVSAIALAPDGRTAALGGPQSPVLWLDLHGGRIHAMLGSRASGVTALAFAPDSRRLVVGTRGAGRNLVLWDLAVGDWQVSPGRVRDAEGPRAVREARAWVRSGAPAGSGAGRTWARWDGQGNKLAEGDFHGKGRHGVWTWWHPNGQKRAEMEYRDGVALGPRREWDTQGNPVSPTEGDRGEEPK